jgi:hypothetical protein
MRVSCLHDSQNCETGKYVHECSGTRNQGLLSWRGPAAIFPTGWTLSPSLGKELTLLGSIDKAVLYIRDKD